MRNRSNESSYVEQRFYLFSVANRIKTILSKNQEEIKNNPKTEQNVSSSMDKLRRSLDSIKKDKCPEFQSILQSCWNLKGSYASGSGRDSGHAPALVIGEAFLDLRRYLDRSFGASALKIIDQYYPMLLDQSMIRLPLVLGLEEYDSLLIKYDGNLSHICQDAVISIGLRSMQTMGYDTYEYQLAETADFDGMNLFKKYLSDSAQDDDSPYFNPFENQRRNTNVFNRFAGGVTRIVGRMIDYDDGETDHTMVLWSPNCRLTREQEDTMLESLNNHKIQTLVVGQDPGHISYIKDYNMVLTLNANGDKYRVSLWNPMSKQSDIKDVNLDSWYVRLYKRPGKPDIGSLHYYKDGI